MYKEKKAETLREARRRHDPLSLYVDVEIREENASAAGEQPRKQMKKPEEKHYRRDAKANKIRDP